MKITDVSLTLFSWESIPSTIYGHHTARPTGKSDLGLLAVGTDDGITGHAFLGTSSNPASLDGPGLIRFLKPILMGQNPLDRERLNRLLWARARAATVRSIGACDVALWDVAGKAAGLPIHRLIGTSRDHIAAYASSVIHASPEAYVDQAQRFQSTGWRAYKIHPPQSWRDDIKVCEAVRKAVGDDYTIMLDSTWSYRYEEALRVGRAIEEMGFYWYEDRSPSRTSTTTSSSSKSSMSQSSRPSSRSRASIPMRRGSCSARPTFCAATLQSRVGSPPWSRRPILPKPSV